MTTVACMRGSHYPLPQHLLYFKPLPHGQGAFRPIFGSELAAFGGIRSRSTSAIFSGLSGSKPMMIFQPFVLQMDKISSARLCV